MTPETPAKSTPAEPAASRSPRRLGRVVLAGVLTVALIAAGIWLIQVLGERDDVASADQSSQDRDTVMLRAKEWMQVFGTYGPDDLDQKKRPVAYEQRLQPLVSKDFSCRLETQQGTAKLSLEEYTEAVGQLISQSRADLRSVVDRTGVETMDDDSARVIVGGTAEPTRGKRQLPAYTYQMRVDLEKIDGSWLVTRCADIPSRFSQ